MLLITVFYLLFGDFFCALVCVVNYSGYFVARWSVLLIIMDLFGAPVCVVTYSGYFLRAFCIINYSCFFGCAGLCC